MIKTNFPEQWEKANPSTEAPVAPKVAKAPKKAATAKKPVAK
jgi:hypothetical protein